MWFENWLDPGLCVIVVLVGTRTVRFENWLDPGLCVIVVLVGTRTVCDCCTGWAKGFVVGVQVEPRTVWLEY